MMNIVNLYSLNIGEGTVDGIDNKLLLKHCLSHQKTISDDETDTHSEDTIIPMSDEVKKIIQKVCDDLGYEVKLHSFWAHIHELNQSTNLHNHATARDLVGGPEISCVYYVSVPKGSGKLVFQYLENKYEEKRYFVNPQEGKYYIFPSTLDHFVTRNNSKENRVSISFNFRR